MKKHQIKMYYAARLIHLLPLSTFQVTAKGPGLERTGVVPNKYAEFTVDARAAGKAPLHISCMDVDYKPVEVQVTGTGVENILASFMYLLYPPFSFTLLTSVYFSVHCYVSLL